MRRLLLLFGFALTTAFAGEYVQAVEFPYYLYPRSLWERELVWLKAIGVRTVAFSIPWNWHELGAGEYDFSGRTSPRRDLAGFVRLLRRLEMRAWVRPLPPVRGLVNSGVPERHDSQAQRAWLHALAELLTTQTASHGGPIAYVDGKALAIDAPAPPGPLAVVSARDAGALASSRKALTSGHGALIWEDVEDALYPAGWSADPEVSLREGAVALNGEERPSVAALRRNADLMKNWGAVFPSLREVALPKPAAGKWPAGVTAVELAAGLASAVNVTNGSASPFTGDVRVSDPGSKRVLVIPGVNVPPGESLWLPVNVALASGGICENCSFFSNAEHIAYATAELHAVEFENGILAMEFAAPVQGEVVLQLARQPSGPYLAGGRPAQFDWDDKNMRARLAIPAGQGPGKRVRIGLAIEAPENSAFFVDAHRLIIGEKNVIATSYSSEQVAGRSRLRLPEGYTARPTVKSPVEIDYEIDVPRDAAHGDWVNLALEADGVVMGRARLQLFRPASVRWTDAVKLHFGDAELTVEPAVAPADAKGGRSLEIAIRNNTPRIQTYQVEATGPGLSFSPAKTEISIGAVMERTVSLRVFPENGAAGLREWKLRVTGGATVEMPMSLVLIPRGEAITWSGDLDGDGYQDWVLENQKIRAVFSAHDGGRWRELTWKDSGTNFLTGAGLWAGSGPVEVSAEGGTLVFTAKDWKRTVRLKGNEVEVEQTTPVSAEGVIAGKRGGASVEVARESANRLRFRFE